MKDGGDPEGFERDVVIERLLELECERGGELAEEEQVEYRYKLR